MLNELLEIMEKQFVLFCFLSFDNERMDIISDIERLCLEEDKCIDFLPRNINSLDNLSIMVHNFYKGDFSLKRYFVLTRFDNILESLKADIENKCLDDVLSDEFYDSYAVYNYARVKFMVDFIKKNDNFSHLAAFTNKEISDYLISNEFNFDALDDIMSSSINEDDLEFWNFYDEHLYLEAQSKIIELLLTNDFNVSDIIFDFNMSILENLFMNMSLEHFNFMKEDFCKDDFYLGNNNYDSILSVFDNVAKKRFSLEHNPSMVSVPLELFDNLVNLIKLEEVIFKNYDMLDLSDEDFIRNFLSLVSFESEILSSINIDEYDADKLSDVIDRDIVFFLSDDNLCELISNRIKNLLPVFKNRSSSIICRSFDLIVRNHIINSLECYKDVICNVSSNENANKYINVYKKVIFEYPDLLNDVMAMNFDFNILFSLDDDLSSKLVCLNDSINYSFDKDEILYNRGLSLIDEINSLGSDNDLFALYWFKICEFDDIINNVSVEHLYSLFDKAENISNSKVKRVLLEKFDYKY